MKLFLRSILILCVLLAGVKSVYADDAAEVATGTVVGSGETSTGTTTSDQEKEKTMNDINAFLIESYKLKIDKIFSDLAASLDRATKGDVDGQIKIYEKIRSDIHGKVDLIDQKNISPNRRKVLEAVFGYIETVVNESIDKLAKSKIEK